jgi:hypothetical protein
MSRQTSARRYFGAWAVCLAGAAVFLLAAHRPPTLTPLGLAVVNAISAVAWLTVLLATVVMFVLWIAALMRLGGLQQWGWFAAVLVVQLVGLGIVGMIAYGVAGPDDVGVVMRPSVT